MSNFKAAQWIHDREEPDFFYEEHFEPEEEEMSSIKSDLLELTGLVYDLNCDDQERDWLMDFSGNIGSVSVMHTPIGIIDLTPVSFAHDVDNLQPVINKVREFSNNLKKSE